MIKLNSLHHVLCHVMRAYLQLPSNHCELYSIWQFQWTSQSLKIYDALYECINCQATWFPIASWLVLCLALFGATYSIYEFWNLYCYSSKPLIMWRRRYFYTIGNLRLRRCRLVASLIMVKAWTLLLYAVLMIEPKYMGPWLVFNFFVLALDFGIWCCELILGRNISKMALIGFIASLGSQCFVRCVKNVFEEAIHANSGENLHWWPCNEEDKMI